MPMLLDVLFESLRFLDRDDLDVCQLASKSISLFIEDSTTLALRSIGNVNVAYSSDRPFIKIWYHKAQEGIVLSQDKMQAGRRDSLVHLRNAYIEHLTLLTGAERCVPLLSGVCDALNFKVGRLHYADHLQETETLQRSVEWIVRDLRVTDYEFSLWISERPMLPTTLTHDSVRATAEYLYVDVCARSIAPLVFERLFDLLFNAPKMAAVMRAVDRRGGDAGFVDEFIRRFIAADDISGVARSVSTLQWLKGDKPHNLLPKMCVTPRRRNVDAPKARLFDKRFHADRYDLRKCDLYVFKNNASGRELHLFAMIALTVPRTPDKDLFVTVLTAA